MNTEHHNKRHTSHRYGRRMLFLFWIFALLLGYLFFNDLQMGFINPNQEPLSEFTEYGTAKVVLLRNRYGHYVTNGGINGQQVVFMLDTGASSVSIPAVVAHKLRLQRGTPQAVQTANGVITVYRTKLDEVSIGEIRLHDVEGHVNPHMQSKEILLGMSFLKQLDFEQSNNQLTLTIPASVTP